MLLKFQYCSVLVQVSTRNSHDDSAAGPGLLLTCLLIG